MFYSTALDYYHEPLLKGTILFPFYKTF
jgi:hypothetical protein